MKTYDKIVLSSQLFERAHGQFYSAECDIDFAEIILLAGAVIGVISPVVAEQGGMSSHNVLAKMEVLLSGGTNENEGLFRQVYNSIKHAGNRKREISAIDDLLFQADLQLEAARLLEAALSDFRQVKVTQKQKGAFSDNFISLLESDHEYT